MRLHYLAALFMTLNAAAAPKITEVHYRGSPEDDFIELFYEKEDAADDIFITTQDNDTYKLPPVKNTHQDGAYLVIRFTEGDDDLDASDGSALVYLNRKTSILSESGDEVYVIEGDDGKVVDFVSYNGGNGDLVPEGFAAEEIKAGVGESLQLVDEKWLSAPPTPGSNYKPASIYQWSLY